MVAPESGLVPSLRTGWRSENKQRTGFKYKSYKNTYLEWSHLNQGWYPPYVPAGDLKISKEQGLSISFIKIRTWNGRPWIRAGTLPPYRLEI